MGPCTEVMSIHTPIKDGNVKQGFAATIDPTNPRLQEHMTIVSGGDEVIDSKKKVERLVSAIVAFNHPNNLRMHGESSRKSLADHIFESEARSQMS